MEVALYARVCLVFRVRSWVQAFSVFPLRFFEVCLILGCSLLGSRWACAFVLVRVCLVGSQGLRGVCGLATWSSWDRWGLRGFWACLEVPLTFFMAWNRRLLRRL